MHFAGLKSLPAPIKGKAVLNYLGAVTMQAEVAFPTPTTYPHQGWKKVSINNLALPYKQSAFRAAWPESGPQYCSVATQRM